MAVGTTDRRRHAQCSVVKAAVKANWRSHVYREHYSSL